MIVEILVEIASTAWYDLNAFRYAYNPFWPYSHYPCPQLNGYQARLATSR